MRNKSTYQYPHKNHLNHGLLYSKLSVVIVTIVIGALYTLHNLYNTAIGSTPYHGNDAQFNTTQQHHQQYTQSSNRMHFYDKTAHHNKYSSHKKHDNEHIDSDNTTTIEADSAFLEQHSGDTIASGHITIKFGQYDIVAGKCLYNKYNNIFIVKDNVSIHDKENNNFYYVNYAKIHLDTKEMELYSFKSNLNNGKILATASNVKKKSATKYSIDNITFSTCKICKKNFVPYAPLWQIRAKKIEIDIDKDVIHYRDVYIDFWEKPILHIPYLITPSFNTKFRTGFLLPSIYAGSKSYGLSITVPYYINFSPSSDMTIIPYFSTINPLILSIENRRVFRNGRYIINGNVTYGNISTKNIQQPLYKHDTKVLRGYITGSGRWDFYEQPYLNYNTTTHQSPIAKTSLENNIIPPKHPIASHTGIKTYHNNNMSDEIYEIGFNAILLFDKNKTYMKRYNYSNEDILLSKVYINKSSNNNYVSANIDNIHDLRDNAYTEKIISIPRVLFSHTTSLPYLNQAFMKFYGTAYELFASRNNIKHERAELDMSLYIPLISNNGQILEIRPHIKTFSSATSPNSSQKGQYSRNINFIPEIISTWRLPLLAFNSSKKSPLFNKKQNAHYHFTQTQPLLQSIFIEPVINLRLAPYQHILQQEKIAQQISLPSAFDILNSTYESQLLDNYHTGNSIQYGIKSSFFLSTKHQIELAIARSQHLYHPMYHPIDYSDQQNASTQRGITTMPEEIEEYATQHTSDIAVLGAIHSPILTIENNTWLSTKNHRIVRNITSAYFTAPKYTATFNYMFIDYNYYQIYTIDHQNEISAEIWYNIYQKWWINANIRNKLGTPKNSTPHIKNSPSIIGQGIGVRYKNECLQIDISVYKNNLQLRDLEPSVNYSINIGVPF